MITSVVGLYSASLPFTATLKEDERQQTSIRTLL